MACPEHRRRVYVAMSGGVDSSVAAALLKNPPSRGFGEARQGFDVVGVFMKPWSSSALISNSKLLISKYCPWKEDREDAMRAASALGIPLKTWDFSKEYKKLVTDYMIREYKAGRTPNPDVMCNKEIKFGLFFDRAMKEGADYIATGHYVIKKESRKWKVVSRKRLLTIHYSLFTARDSAKDQSYFLWTFKQKQLEKCIFPIGDYIKPEVRKMARKFGLPNHDKKDSQGVCFIGPLDMKDFLKTKIKTKQGEIRLTRSDLKGVSRSDLENSSNIGTHDGVYYYTIGQRHGLDIGIGGGPYYVVSKNIKKNIIYVGDEKDLYSRKLNVSGISWIGEKPGLPIQLDVRLRYRAGLKKAVLNKNGELKLKTPERAITSGQSAVFYRKGELLGGGIID
ncbi:MAG: tRNA 2-thiouridine(34) synthase MnmA [Candidatus Yanofskybacteria bacterium]|nr:tRNA 2-thiouridine(34) synthase MnmA [Candidatus Yanofskybacteria bacterium]